MLIPLILGELFNTEMLLLQHCFSHPRDPQHQPAAAALRELSHNSHHPLGDTKQQHAQGKSSSDGCPHQRKQIPESEPWDEKPLLHKPEARHSNVSAELPQCCSHASPALDAAGKLRALCLSSALEVEREAALL